VLAAKAAAATARALPGSKTELNGTTALVSRNVKRAPNIDFTRSRTVWRGRGYVEVPRIDGVMFVIRLLAGGPSINPSVRQGLQQPEFDPRRATRHMFFFKTTTIMHFDMSAVTVIIDVLFGAETNQRELKRAYAALNEFLNSELKN
jgi:hypothetical protein